MTVQTLPKLHEESSLSRRDVIEQLKKLGVDTSTFESFSINQLNDLLLGLNRVLISYDVAKNGRRDKLKSAMPILSDTDRKLLKALLSSRGRVSILTISKELNIPQSTVQRRRKALETNFLDISYSLRIQNFGWRTATLFVGTQEGLTSNIGKELSSWDYGILSVSRTMGENAIDLQLEVVFESNSQLLDIIEKLKAIRGVKSVSWSEEIELIGRNTKNLHSILESA